ncbi:flagellar basal body L-ring protein FlgH [Croceicoccus hydrothermalis]|uniref:flagellar basal body L-ring protein FlgH n=1 Tax=Croceicoccus hydrothermalis TaxID=2867964 RepID=UPI001EFC19A0|nr:flagellar basal body L-ring protein FlgH [Croceicoccus hydrothermalis]
MRGVVPLSVGIMGLMLSACATTQPQPGYQAALPAPPPVYTPRDGAIFHAADGYAGLHSGARAARVGDPVTVLLVEFIDATKNADARTQRNGSASITPPAAGPLDFLNPEALKAAAQSSFNGRGDAAQGSALTGAIAVTIAEVRPNGTALIKGERQMLLSQGTEWVQFSGIIRLVDIDYNNQILSTAVADARIIYAGDGAVQQASRPGWLSRFFGRISPF